MIDIIVGITKLSTSEIRSYPSELPMYEDGSPSLYIWQDGNYRCDCNRHLFFARAHGKEEDWEGPCGETEYHVTLWLPTGEVIYSEEEDVHIQD